VTYTRTETQEEAVVALFVDELLKARSIHPKGIVTQHDGWAVIHDEMVELFDAIRAKHPDGVDAHDAEVVKEVVQVGAMALRFLLDLGFLEQFDLEHLCMVRIETALTALNGSKVTTEDLADALSWAQDIIDPAESDILERGEGDALDQFRQAVEFVRFAAAHHQQQIMDEKETTW
jgi:hypothetical protein